MTPPPTDRQQRLHGQPTGLPTPRAEQDAACPTRTEPGTLAVPHR